MIPILDLKQQYSSIKGEIDAAIQEVLTGAHFILGPQVVELEKRVAAYCECGHGVGVASGTDALRLAFQALNLGPGDEVITTPFTFVATGNTISHCGAQPVFADINPQTYNLDPAMVEAAITERTKAIVPVHLYGQACDMDALLDIARRHNLKVVEDCAQAIGGRFDGKRLGSLGDAGCLSFFPSKNLGAYGDGGMVVTSDSDLADKIDVLRRQGGKKKYFHEVLGFNSRLDTLQAAILNVKLNYLDQWQEGRRTVAHRYNELLADSPVTTPHEAPNTYHVYHQYTIRTPRRDELAEHLKQQGIMTMVYYPVCLHKQPLYAEMADMQLPHAEAAAQEVLSLPIFPELTADDQRFIADSIKAFYQNKS
ncbi:MAG TPA: DegT/DnrJ/EryC1/StrS family aminotransferase [Abditibacteriaceae bacterium]|jgi:dTDP-4-amino-4,6-dideoxygalactose transaminase